VKHGKISLFGNFGTQNLGNECTLQAALYNIRARLPGIRVDCICSDPDDVSARYGIPALSLYCRDRHASPPATGRRYTNALRRLGRRVFLRLPQECLHWLAAIRTLKGTDALIMTGTGMLTDFGITPLDLHYEIFKWSVAAKVARCKLAFLSVGASRLAHPVSRWLVTTALSLADYRSYRDDFSRECLAAIGATTAADPVCPDLAFSFPPAGLPAPPAEGPTGRVVGLGLMDYYGRASRQERGEQVYRRYVETMSEFAAWLLSRGYTVRLLIGDLSYDRRAKEDVRTLLRENGVSYDPCQLIDEPVTGVEQLMSQLAATDIVVATRFHNVLLSMLLNKPVLAISYDAKISSLMAGAGLAEYCEPVDELKSERLVSRFLRLQVSAARVRRGLCERVDGHRRALDQQYAVLLATLGLDGPVRSRPVPAVHTEASLTKC
jgi:polysaccharide pyruvyl transferase WcaK-like protein